MNFYTGDEHYNHENIITKFVFRPFRSVLEMNETMILKHNSRVKEGDTVFHVGDFKLTNKGESASEIISRLKGNHVFINGNHDKRNGVNTPIEYLLLTVLGKRVVFAHQEEIASQIMKSYMIVLEPTFSLEPLAEFAFVGHVHEKWKFKDNMVNVGVDQWDFYPVTDREIFSAYKKWRLSHDRQETKEITGSNI